MQCIKDSYLCRLLNNLDITEDSFIFKHIQTGFFLRTINSVLAFSQNLFEKITSNSLFVKKIDVIILALISILLISLLFAPTKIIGLISLLSFVVFTAKLFFKKGEKLELSTLDPQIFLYMLIAGLSVFFSSLLFPAIKGYAKLLVYFGVYLTFFNILKDKPSRSLYLLGLAAITGLTEALFAIYQNFIGVEALATWQDNSSLNPEQIMTRVYGTIQPLNPNLLAGYLIATLPATIGMFFTFAIRKKTILSLFFAGASAAILLATIFTGCRGAYLATGVMMTAATMISGHIIWHDFPQKTWLKRIWIYVVLAGIAGVLLLIITSPALQHRITSIFSFRDDSSNSFRVNVYIASIQMFFDNWLIGIGPGNEVFRLIYGMYMKAGFDALGAYSVPLEIAVESGIFALLAFIWLLVSAFIKAAKIIMYGTNTQQKIIVSCCLVSVVGIMTHGLVDTIFFRPQVQLLFWVFIAVLGANAKSCKTKQI